MKNLLKCLVLTVALCAIGPANAATTLTIQDGKSVTALFPGQVVSVRCLSSVPTGTCTLKAASQLPVVSSVAHYTHTTNFTYTVTYTNGAESVTETYNYLPLPLGPTVTAYTTNSIVTTVTNYVPTASSVVAVTNDLTSALTCAGGVATATPTGKYIFPGDVLHFTGSAKGRVDVIIEE